MPDDLEETTSLCRHCGLGSVEPPGGCTWCGMSAGGAGPMLLPGRDRFWRFFSRLPGLRMAARFGPVALATAAGGYAGLALAAVGIPLELSLLAVAGFDTPDQWWWIFLPEPLQGPVQGLTRGALLGALIALAERSLRSSALASRWPMGLSGGTVLGATITFFITYCYGADLERLLLAAAGGAITGAAVDQSLARVSPAPRPPAAAGTSNESWR